MAAQTTDRPWSSTQVLGTYHNQVPPATAPQGRETIGNRCHCCPYGYHIDVDFLDYLNAIKAGSGLSKLKKIHGHRLRQRQAMETQLLMIRPPTSSPPPLGSADSGGTDVSESSGSSSPVTPRSQSEDERDATLKTTTATGHQLMADLDASIADALDSIEALMQPRQQRMTESSYEGSVVSGNAASGCRSISTGDVRWSSVGVDGQTSASTNRIGQLPEAPPSTFSSVSCSSLHDDNKHTPSSTLPDVFQPPSTHQPLGTDSHGGKDDSSSQSSAVTEVIDIRRQSETTTDPTVATTSAFHESSLTLPSSSSGVITLGDKSRAPRPPVKLRSSISVGTSRDQPSEGTATTAFSSGEAGDAVHRLPVAGHTGEIFLRRGPAIYEGLTAQHSTFADPTVSVQTTSATTTSVSVLKTTTDISSSGRQLPMLPKPTDPETSSARTSKQSSFSSVRALLNRKSGSSPSSSTARVDRPARRSRHQVSETDQVRITTGDAIKAPVVVLPDETAPASDGSLTTTDQRLQYSKNECTGTSIISVPRAESEESITAPSCSDPAAVAETEATQPESSVFSSSLSRDQVDHDSLEVSFEELTKAMAMLSPVVEGSQDGDDTNLDQSRSSLPPAINPDVLLTIRKYIASSLHQMRVLEQQVKLIPVLQLRVSVLKEEKRLLSLQLQKAKNGSSATGAFKVDACVGVTLSELPVAEKERDLSVQPESISLPDQLQSSVERREVGTGDFSVNTDSTLYCQNCKSSLRQHSWHSPATSEAVAKISKDTEEEFAHLQKPELVSENVSYPSVSLLISKLEGEDKKDAPATGRLWSVEKAIHESVTSPECDLMSAATTSTFTGETTAAVHRPKPPVPRKQISIHREEGTNRSSVGVQCTLLKDDREGHQDSGRKILLSEFDTVTKYMGIERADIRAHEPDLVTTHCLGGLSQNEHDLRSATVYHLKTFADKETETDNASQHSAAVNTVSSTALCSVDILTKPATSDASSWTDESLLSSLIHDISKQQFAVEVKPSVKDVECLADITIKPSLATTACNTETSWDQLLSRSKISMHEVACDTSELVIHPLIEDVPCAYIDRDSSTVKDIRKSDANDTFCQTDLEERPLTREVACGHIVESVDQSQLANFELLADSNTVDVACGSEVSMAPSASVPNVTDVGCNTDYRATRDVCCSTTEEKQPMKHISCLADIKLSVCDKSSSTVSVTEFTDETVRADEQLTPGQSGKTSQDVACLTNSLTTGEMSSNTEAMATASGSLPADACLSNADVGCLTDVLWKPPTNEMGCNTDADISFFETSSLSNVAAVPFSKDVPLLKPHSTTVALNTDAWLLTSDLAFLDTVRQILRPSVTESASMTDVVEKLQTCDASTSTICINEKQHMSECWTNTDVEVKPSFVDVESLARPAVCEVSCNTEFEDKRQQVRDAAGNAEIILRQSATDVSVNTEVEAIKPTHSVASNTSMTIHPAAVDAVSSVVSLPSQPTRLASGTTDVLPSIKDASSTTDIPTVCHVSVATEAIPRHQVGVGIRSETKDVACDAGHIPTTDTAINTDFSISLLQAKQEPAAVDVSVSSTQDTGSMIDPLQPLQENVSVKTNKDVACDTSDVILPTYEEACNWDEASFKVDAAIQAKLLSAASILDRRSTMAESVSSVNKCPTCLAKLTTRANSRGTDSPSLTDDLIRHSATYDVESAIPSRAACDVGCNTDMSQTIPTKAEVACNTESRTVTCDVGLNTDAVMDVSLKTSRIPQKSGAAVRRPDALATKPVTKDAFSITDIVIAPSDENEVLRKTDNKEQSSPVVSLPSTSEVACNTDVIESVETSKKLSPAVRSVGCSADLTSVDSKPSTRDAGCSARPQTKSQSCVTDPVSSEPVTDTPVKAVERTRSGLQITRKNKKQSKVTSTQSTDTLSTPTTPNAPVAAAAKSPTFDVACGTDVEFNSKYLHLDDGGFLRQLSADDVAEIFRLRDHSSSLSSPTCDVACNTEYDSRPCTPARLSYSNYYAVAAVDPMPPTAADVACGPDTPSPALCDVGCGTESDTPFQTFQRQSEVPLETVKAAVETERPPTSLDQACDTSDLPRTISQPEVDLEQSATHKSDEGTPMTDAKPEKCEEHEFASQIVCAERHRTSTAVGDFDVREELVVKSNTIDSNSIRGQVSGADRRGLRLDIGLASGPVLADELREDFNNNDNNAERQTDELQTSGSCWNDELGTSPTPILAAGHDVKFIDDDDDAELDSADQKRSDRKRTKINITSSDEDVESSSTAADLGRRWGTVDLIPKPSASSPLLTPSAGPLKSIMKSPRSSSEKTLSQTRKGISFSQDTVFK